jgi:hypothetical protein
MHKKLTTACLALVALAAFVLPAAAQAVTHPVLTHPTGTVLATGTKITATNTANSLLVETNGTTKLTCTKVSMTGTLTNNVTGTVKGNISAAAFSGTGEGGACTGIFNAVVTPESLPWCLKSEEGFGADEFQVAGGACGGAATKIKFKLTVFGGAAHCEYESTSTTAVKGTYTTHSTGDAILSTPRSGHTATEDSGFVKTFDNTPFELCPKSSALQMSLTMETDETTAKPIYISE